MTTVSEVFPVMISLKCRKCCHSTSAKENIALLKRVDDILHLCTAQLAAAFHLALIECNHRVM